MRGLKGKVGIIAGGGRGIGGATAKRLAEEGARVIVGDICVDWAEATAESINKAGGTALSVHVDATSPDSVAGLVRTAKEKFGGLDFFHSNLAGGTVGDNHVLDCSLEVFDKSVAINMKSHFICTQQALPAMIERGGGAMIYTSSGAAHGGFAWQVVYPMTKNAIHPLVRHVATRFGKQGIRANAVAPGLVLTEAVREHMTDAQVEGMRKTVPHTRLGQPEDIAGMVAMLASDDGIWINGQVFSVNGGMSMRD